MKKPKKEIREANTLLYVDYFPDDSNYYYKTIYYSVFLRLSDY